MLRNGPVTIEMRMGPKLGSRLLEGYGNCKQSLCDPITTNSTRKSQVFDCKTTITVPSHQIES